MLADPSFWVGLAFMLTVALIAKPIWRGISSSLDEHAEKIRAQIEEARKLREDAQALLADYQRKQREALAEAEKIVHQARQDAERLKSEAEAELARSIERRRAQANERISQTEAQALASVRDTAIDVAVAATEKLIKDKVTGDKQAALVDQAIQELPSRLNTS